MKSYKWMTLVCLAVLMLGVFAGCSSSEGGTSAASETETAAQAMRTVETDKGEVEIPEEPKVIFSDYYLG